MARAEVQVKTLGQIAKDAWFKVNVPNSNDGDWEAAAQAVRAAVIEECAKVAETGARREDYNPTTCLWLVDDIRALKDKT
jgi:hypothetical protein